MCHMSRDCRAGGDVRHFTFISAERVEDSYGIRAVSEDEKTFWWGCKGCDVMNRRHYGNQFKEEDVNFGVWRALAKLVNKTVVPVDK
jgi:hypothetical protein